ncbi:MAG: thiosulfate sulfurtransferase [Firmicutes bacterium]|nr:thiosulfate sulfurtransferase [Bacillota bacterium]
MKKNFILLTIVLVSLSVFIACQDKASEKVKSDNDEVSLNIVTTEDLKKSLKDKNTVVVDIRSEAQYIGWKSNGVKRGGHIKGAVDFPLTWTKDLNNEKLNKLLNTKGITKNKTIIVYGQEVESSKEMMNILKNLEYKNVKVYKEGITKWASNKNLPMDRLKRYEKLVHPKWIKDLIDGKSPKTYNNKSYKIFEVSWGEGKDYKKGHIPGAYHLDTNLIEEEPLWNVKSDKDLETMLVNNGITYNTTVVLYGKDTTAAARAASVLMYSGVKDVRILNGGYAAWTKKGYEVEKDINKPEAVKEFGLNVPSNPEYIVGIEKAKKILTKENAELVSIRSWPEYIGETSGYTYIEPKGRIKGAKWGHAGSDAYHMEHFRNIDNTMRNYNEIKKFWKEWDITSDKEISFFCGTGWRASETFFYAYLMGWDNISVYDGGWFEWSMDKSNPIEKGEPNK